MNYRNLGATDLKVSEIGVGCARLGATSRKGTEEDVLKMLLRAFELGVTFYDTADSYGQGKSEELLGRAFAASRDQVVIATKGGYRLSAAGGLAARLKPLVRPLARSLRPFRRSLEQLRASQINQDFSPSYIKQAVEGSLTRMRTDRIDLYQLHSPPTEILRSGEFVSVMEQLRAEGKIRYYGASCLTVEDAVLCLEHSGVSSVQVAINVLEREAIGSLLPLAAPQGVGVVARQPLASGFLSNPSSPRGRERDLGSLQNPTHSLAEDHFLVRPGSRTLSQAAIRFVLQQDGVSVVLPGISTIEHLEENVGAVRAPALTAEELAWVWSGGHS